MVVSTNGHKPPVRVFPVKAGGTGPRSAQWADTGACVEVLAESRRRFGVSLYRLGVLLGLSHRISTIYEWMAGDRRPGSKYMIRLVVLYGLFIDGVDVSSIRTIDWAEGIIKYFDGRMFRDGSMAEQRSASLGDEVLARARGWSTRQDL